MKQFSTILRLCTNVTAILGFFLIFLFFVNSSQLGDYRIQMTWQKVSGALGFPLKTLYLVFALTNKMVLLFFVLFCFNLN